MLLSAQRVALYRFIATLHAFRVALHRYRVALNAYFATMNPLRRLGTDCAKGPQGILATPCGTLGAKEGRCVEKLHVFATVNRSRVALST